MITFKIAYNDATKQDISYLLKVAEVNPFFESYNESNPKELKKAWAIKSSGGARECPFVGVFENGELIKGFYAEDKSSNENNVIDYAEDYFKSRAKKGFIVITKIEGGTSDNLNVPEFGYTENFIEGVGLKLSTPDSWYHTSIITSIDWEGKTFKTLNSTYKFDFKNDN